MLNSIGSWAQNSMIDSLESLLERPLDDSIRAEVLIKLSFQYGFLDYNKALGVAEEARNYASRLNYPEIIARNYQVIGVIHFLSRKYDSAMYYHQISRDLALENEDSLLVAKNLNSIGLIHLNQARYQLALDHLQNSNAIHTALNNTSGMGSTLNNIGTTYERTEQYDLAIEAYKKSLLLSKKVKNERVEANAYVNLGAAFLRDEEYDSAEYYQELALKLQSKRGNKSDMSETLRNLAELAFVREDYPTARDRYERAIELMTELGGGRAGPVSALGITYAHLGDFVQAKKYLTDALEIAEDQSDSWEKSEALLRLSRVYEMQNDLRKSLDYYQQHITLKDSLFDLEKSNQLFELQTLYDTERKNNEIENLAANNKIQTLQLSQSQQERNLFVGLTVLALILVSFLVYNQRQKQKANQALQKAVSEKETLLKEIHHRVKNNLQVISSLLNLQSKYVEDQSAIDAVKEGQNRVKSMALIHQKLYQEDNLTGITISDYIENLAESLYSSYGVDRDRIDLNLSVEKLNLDVDTTIPLGLIINELISNTLKYAFPEDRTGQLSISLKQSESCLMLLVKDNGVGLPKDLNWKESPSFGLKLVSALAEKLKASLEINNEKGTIVSMIISQYKLV